MRRLRILPLFLLIVLLFVGCGDSALQTQTQTDTQTQTQAQNATTSGGTGSNNTIPTVAVPHRFTYDQLKALPVANASMSETELRQLCVDYFRLAQTFEWTPEKAFNFTVELYDKTTSFQQNRLFAGFIYDHHGNANLYMLDEYYNTETGVLSLNGINSQALASILTNHCTSGSTWGWARVCNEQTWVLNREMIAYHGCIPVGEYRYDTSKKEWSTAYSTNTVCNENGEQVMYRSYAALKPADGVNQCPDDSGHVMMVVESKAVTKPDGSIDGKESYVVIIDQSSSWEKYVYPDNSTAQIQGDVDRKFSYEVLFKGGYLPFTLAELCGKAPVEAATATTDLEGSTVSVAKLAEGTLNADYNLAVVSITLTDKNGKELYTTSDSTFTINQRSYQLKEVSRPAIINRYLSDGDCNVKITCTLGNGEELVAFEGTLTK